MYLEKFKLNGKTAFITGGGQGIGLGCAEALAEAGARVIIGDRDSKIADSAKASLKAKGFDIETAIMDVTDTKRVAEVANDLVARHGKVDILVNNAGIARSETPAETVPTSTGSTSSTSISTAPSGAAANSASTC